MRLTAENMGAAFSTSCEVLLNGRQLAAVIVADEEAGVVVLLRRTADGKS